MITELISVGTEILLGNITNTNASFLAEQCAALGLSCYYQISVGDNEERLAETIKTALSRSDVVILTGGLGPTEDDLTKEVTAKVLGRALVEDKHSKKRIQEYFKKSVQATVTENNWKQAQIIEGCQVVDNHNGTAPGLIIKTDEGKHILLMPGPPNELYPMFERDMKSYLASLTPEIIYSKTVKLCGIGESLAETRIKDLIEMQSNPTIAPYAKTAEVHLRVTAKAASTEEAKAMIRPVVQELKKRFGSCVYTTKEAVTLEQCVVDILKKRGMTVTTAESCSGGMLAARLINVDGASEVFNQGMITYADAAKEKLLGVSAKTLKKHGAVSEKTARAMAKGAAAAAGADAAVAITGIAGPGGSTLEKPVGLVYISCYVNGHIETEAFHFRGNRQKIREYAVARALEFLRRCLLKYA